jgi:TonB family protein
MNLFFAVTTLIALSLFLNNDPAQSMEKQAVSDTQRTLASDLDAELPKLPFNDWFGKVVGPKAGVVWQLSECGDRLNAEPNGDGDMQACVEVNTILSDGRRVIVMIAVGTFKKGVTGPPAFRFGVIAQNSQLVPIQRLRDLEKLLSRLGKPLKSPATELPEVSIPSATLAGNNTSSTGTRPWAAEDFGQFMPIEDQEPPPAEPPARSPARSTSTSNAEIPDKSGEVRQGTPTFKPQPKYPQNARRFHASGEVKVRVTISVAGRVTKAVAISGHPLLRDAAVEAARRWEFEPTLAGGVPVETELVLTFDFTNPPPPS